MALDLELPVDLFESDAKAESSKEAIRFYIQHLSRNDLKAVEVLCLQLSRASESYQDWKEKNS